MMETVSRHSLVLTGVGKTTRDAFLRHFAHPHTCVGTPPLAASHFRCGVGALSRFSRFVRHQQRLGHEGVLFLFAKIQF